jgi:hypothetical protein
LAFLAFVSALPEIMRVRRKLDVCVLSDVHLGTYGCHAKELNEYLKTIEPKELISKLTEEFLNS